MQRNKASEDRLLVLTLTLETAVEAEDWLSVTEMFKAREEIIESSSHVTETCAKEIGAIEERILNRLRQRLSGVKGDLRNLTAALRIASSYANASQPSRFSLAS